MMMKSCVPNDDFITTKSWPFSDDKDFVNTDLIRRYDHSEQRFDSEQRLSSGR